MKPVWLPKYCQRRDGSSFLLAIQISSKAADHCKPLRISKSERNTKEKMVRILSCVAVRTQTGTPFLGLIHVA
jgi:hypothetical protein